MIFGRVERNILKKTTLNPIKEVFDEILTNLIKPKLKEISFKISAITFRQKGNG